MALYHTVNGSPVEIKNIVIGGAEAQETVTGNNTLSLPDAKANSLTSVVLDGATEQRNLPVGYTQVEYIESTGTQLIDTGINGTQITRFVVKGTCAPTSGGNNSQLLGGTNSSAYTFFGCRVTVGTPYWYCRDASGGLGAPSHLSIIDCTINSTTSQTGTLKDLVTGTTEGFISLASSDWGFPDENLLLFGGDSTRRSTDVTCYSLQLYTSSGLVRNLIPCRRNSDSVLGMYDTVTGTFLTNQGTGTFTAGTDAVPSPDTPIDIVCNNGALKYNNNIADNTITGQGTFVSPSSASSTRIYKYFGKLPSGDYTISITGGFEFIVQYRDADPPVAGMTYGNMDTWTTSGTYTLNNPDYFYGIAIRYPNDGAIAPSDFDGTIALRPNFVNVDGTQETVQVTGKNLFDTQWQVGIYNTTSGEFTPMANRICNTNMIPIKPSTSYTVSCPDYALSNGMRWVFYDANKNFISAITNGATTVSTPSNAKYINFYIANNLTVETAPNLQLEQGSTATTYEPYFNGGTATAQMLLKVGTYKDTQEVISGAVTRNVGVKVFDGTESWSTGSATNPNRYTLAAAFNDLADLIDDNIGYSNCYTVISRSTSIQSSLQNNECGWNTTKVFCVRDDRIATLADWKQYLADQYNAGTPVMVVYPLATATTESVTAQTLTVQQGANTLTATGSTSTLGLSATYTKGTQLKPDYVIRNGKLVWAKPNMYLTGPVNYTVVGSLSIIDNIASGFGTTATEGSNVGRISASINSLSSPFEIATKFKTGNSVTQVQALFCTGAYSAVLIYSDGTIRVALSSNGTSNNICSLTTTGYTVTINTEYWIKLSFTGTQYLLELSTDGVNYTTIWSTTSSNVMYAQEILFGSGGSKASQTTNSFLGSINLNETYIKSSGALLFYGKNYATQNIAPVPSGYTYGTTTTSAIGFVDMRTQAFTAAPSGATIGRDS